MNASANASSPAHTVTKHRHGAFTTTATTRKKIPDSFSRPWQAQIVLPEPGKCVFEKPEERAKAFLQVTLGGETWYVMDSLYAPEPVHRLIVPETCWEPFELRRLGGAEKIRAAVNIAQDLIRADRANSGRREFCFSVQIGPLAAQNQPHLHYHVYSPEDVGDGSALRPIGRSLFEPYDNLTIFENSRFIVQAGGIRTGQAIILPGLDDQSFDGEGVERDLAEALHLLVLGYGERFRSTQGLPPDFRFEIRTLDGKIDFGLFTPCLNNIGTKEDMAFVMPDQRALNLAWSHEETARALRG